MSANERWVLFLLIAFVVTLAIVGGMIHRDHEERLQAVTGLRARLEKLQGAMQTEALDSGQAPDAESRAVPVAPSSTDGKGGCECEVHGCSTRSSTEAVQEIQGEVSAAPEGATPEGVGEEMERPGTEEENTRQKPR